MKLKAVSGIMLTLLLVSMLTFAFNIQTATAVLPVHNIDTGEDFATIQAAINDTDTFDGHTIQVDAGTYYENIVLNKSISLVGDSMETTIIDGEGVGIVIHVLAGGVTISGFRIENILFAEIYPNIYLHHSCGNNISGNRIVNAHGYGIWLSGSSENNITSNIILGAYSHQCILLTNSNNNVISGNIAGQSDVTISLGGSSHNLISRNKIAGNMATGVALSGGSNNNSITKNTIEGNCWGLRLSNSNGNSIFGNNITTINWDGICLELRHSNNNTISGNRITNNDYYGIALVESSNNKFYHNNFIDNTQQVYIPTSGYANFWDDGYPSGGNYWSDYTGVDVKSGPNQDQPSSDGIGDKAYVIDADNRDHYPLVNPWTPTETSIKVQEKDYPVTIVSNTTIDQIGATANTLNFTSSGPTGEKGYILVIFPMINTTEMKVFIDGVKLTPPPFPVINTNGTHYFIYFEFTLSIHNIAIQFAPLEYTLTIYSSPSGITFTVDGVSRTTPWSGTYSEGASVGLVMPETHYGYMWYYWLEDIDTNRIKTVTMDTNTTLTGVFRPPVGGIYVPVNKLELLAPYIALTMLLAVAIMSLGYIKKRKRHTELKLLNKQSKIS